MPLVEEIDQRRFNVIDSKVRRFYQIPDSNPGFRRAKIEQYFRHIYHSNAIEGNTLSLAQTRSILETRLAVGGKSLLEQNEVLGLDAALRFLNSTLLRGHHTTITLSTILELHRHVLSFVDPSEAGNLRHTQVFIADHNPPPPDSVLDLMNELVTWLNGDQLSDVHPIELAALTHWKLVYIHPFYDGNGRTARLLMNLILMRAGLPPAIIKLEDRQAYYEHLKTANEGDVRPFIRFIASCTERTIDEYLIAAEPHQIEPEVQRLPSEPSVVKLELPEPYSLSWSAWPFALSSIPTHKPQPPSASRRPIRYAELVDPIELPQVIYLEG
ncbi:Adenosine monophosphate-protein transferase FICD [Fasciola gigantica]|uniref:Adenosine monophosphate-protein transferase FICD n=1 Tax=Fasciola gigantica TaxID=46835 RepID=A0A504Z4V9_FASGI|nr:Adenosine monophosphate-protein transferase FICD [Fasciola gigantica]